MRATFFGLMVFPVHLDDQFQCNTAEVGRIGRNRMLSTELLLSAPSITDHLPHGVRKLVCPAALVSRKRDCLRVSARSSSWAGGLVHDPPEFDSQRPAPSPPTPLPQTSLGERGARAKGLVSKWCSGLWSGGTPRASAMGVGRIEWLGSLAPFAMSLARPATHQYRHSQCCPRRAASSPEQRTGHIKGVRSRFGRIGNTWPGWATRGQGKRRDKPDWSRE